VVNAVNIPNVIAAFEERARSQPKKVAIFYGSKKISYGDLREKVERLAGGLRAELRPERGERIGVLLKNCPEYVDCIYAVLKSGCTLVPINTFLKGAEVRHVLQDCGVKTLISSAEFADVLKSVADVPTLERILVADDVQNVPKTRPLAEFYRKNAADSWPEIKMDDLALVIYTSGTTGKPKGAMLTHANIASNVHSCVKCLHETADDRMTLMLPMFHTFMLTVCVFTPLSMGASIILIKSLHPFKNVLKEMIRRRATIFVGIPQIFQALAQAKIPFWAKWLLPLRMAVSGAAPLPAETLKEFAKKFSFPLLEGYGLSEASPVVSFNPVDGVQKPGSVGLPIPDVEVKIIDEHGNDLPVGEVGEIIVRGPNVMQGYWNQPEETAATLRNGWLHTGDMGKLDEDGYLYIVDRKKEMLLVRGMNVYPREIEEVLYQFPDVGEAAVVAKNDPNKGEVPIAFVAPREGATLNAKEILKFCKDCLADYKIPREVRIKPSLPRTATGKIAKLELKKEL
jgi:long-chain acyl-CoA synthetase